MDPTRLLVTRLARESGPIAGSLSLGSAATVARPGPGFAIAAQLLPFAAAEAAATPARGRTSSGCRPGRASR